MLCCTREGTEETIPAPPLEEHVRLSSGLCVEDGPLGHVSVIGSGCLVGSSPHRVRGTCCPWPRAGELTLPAGVDTL